MAIKKKTESKNTPKMAKKNGGKKPLKRVIITAAGDRCFWTHDGPVLCNLKDLAAAFTNITEKQFNYHVNNEKNDFAAWVEFVLLDPECAKNLRKAKTKMAARASVIRALKGYR
jgi:hypothetical protein